MTENRIYDNINICNIYLSVTIDITSHIIRIVRWIN